MALYYASDGQKSKKLTTPKNQYLMALELYINKPAVHLQSSFMQKKLMSCSFLYDRRGLQLRFLHPFLDESRVQQLPHFMLVKLCLSINGMLEVIHLSYIFTDLLHDLKVLNHPL